MITAIRPYTPQNRQQQNFKALPIEKISEMPYAEHFTDAVAWGTKDFFMGFDRRPTEENVKDLHAAITRATEKEEFEAVGYLTQVRDNFWKEFTQSNPAVSSKR